jgi:hypothetical protein
VYILEFAFRKVNFLPQTQDFYRCLPFSSLVLRRLKTVKELCYIALPRFTKEHCFLEGFRTWPVSCSGKSNM